MYYTRKEVADLLGISKVTVYHYAKQNKIRKVPDPHHAMREARYFKEEVDALAEKRQQAQAEGYSTSALSKKLGITQQRIYQLIKENELVVHEVPHGDERIRYIIPEETAEWIKNKVEQAAPTRGIRSEFYDSSLDISLYQLFTSSDRSDARLVRNENGDWGFYTSTRSWIPYERATHQFGYKPAYSIHRPLVKVTGYTDFILPKDNELSFLFLDYIYMRRGIENIRLREYEHHLALSIKAGAVQLNESLHPSLTESVIRSFLEGGAGEILFKEEEWIFISGYRKTSIELPVTMLDTLQQLAINENSSLNELIEQAIKDFIQAKEIKINTKRNS